MEKNMNIHSVKAVNVKTVRKIDCTNDNTTVYVYDIDIVGEDDSFTITIFSEDNKSIDINISEFLGGL